MITYIYLSYVVGILLYITDHILEARTNIALRLYMLALSPLVAWYGALHYIQLAFCKITGRPIKYWI